jgi:hypothetical protein
MRLKPPVTFLQKHGESEAMDHSCKRLERSFKVLNGRLWSSANWNARGEYSDWELLAVMHGNYHGMRFKKRVLKREMVVQAVERYNLSGTRAEGLVHKIMKASAEAYLLDAGYSDAHEEARCFGGRVDAASLSGNVYIECGDTSPSRVIDISLTDGATGYLIPDTAHNNAAVHPPYSFLNIYKFQITDAAISAYEKLISNRQQEGSGL